MHYPTISKSTFQFLKKLENNNNRDWFNLNKNLYVESHKNMCDFVDSLIAEMKKHDSIDNETGRKTLYRIYSDTRFSKDKAPYNPRFAFSLKRSTKHRRGGYYMHIKPGNTYLACGFFAPNPEDLLRIRQDISDNFGDWKKLLNKKQIKLNFGSLRGAQLATSPKGFSKEDPAIELLRHKQFFLRFDFDDTEVLSHDFVLTTNNLFKSVRPYFDYMSEVLTTNRDGESIV